MINACILLGGLTQYGDGYLTSSGMYGLAAQLRKLPKVETTVLPWAKWQSAPLSTKGYAKNVVIGFSGGGSRATWLANHYSHIPIDLMVLYDPSPSWQMKPIGDNVKFAICYHNILPLMFGLGGGELVGPQVETYDIAEQHLLVQFDQRLHNRTIEAVEDLL